MQDFLKELNESQLMATTYLDGPQLVIAGAGSGKTRVLTYKIAYLLEHGYQPWNILALTFTNKAAREMKERIARLVGAERSSSLYMGTFHSIFLRFLRMEAQSLGYQSSFTIYDAADSKSLVTHLIKEMNLGDEYKPGTVQSIISNAKNRMISPEDFSGKEEQNIREESGSLSQDTLGQLYATYQARCRAANAMDFDDLLLNTYLLFKNHPEILEKYRDRFHYVLVDEYQDTNLVQHKIIQQLCQSSGRICVVGDDAQSIYSFRGAEIGNILSFTRCFEGARIFKLEQNYRSTQNIVQAANDLIRRNRFQIEKNVFSKKESGERIKLHEAYTSELETQWIVRQILGLRQKDLRWKDMAILYRVNSLSRQLEEKLRNSGVPYRIYGGLSFYQRKEIKDVVAYLRMVCNPDDEEAFLRIINYPARGIGQVSVQKILSTAHSRGISPWMAIQDEKTMPLGKAALGKVAAFRELITGLRNGLEDSNAYEMGLAIINQSGIRQELMADQSVEGLSKRENLEELVNSLNVFVQSHLEEGNENIQLPYYLSEISLMTDMDKDDTSGEGDMDVVTLMTIHAAKGLEFPVVFITGIEEDILPSDKSQGKPKSLEEERRLFYVALTRAERQCFMSYSLNRMKYGMQNPSRPSRFLNEISKEYLDIEKSIPSFSSGSSYGSNGSLYGSQRSFGGQRRDDWQDRSSSYADRDSNAPWRKRYEHSNEDVPWKRSTSYERERPQPPVIQKPAPGFKRLSPSPASSSKTSSSAAALREGQIIQHERFGIGKVLEVIGAGSDAKATIQFEQAGKKVLLLKFAKYRVIG